MYYIYRHFIISIHYDYNTLIIFDNNFCIKMVKSCTTDVV